jgi:hypothetical protein
VKRFRVLVLVRKEQVPREDVPAAEVKPAWQMEWDVVTTLRKRGHELLVIGVLDDLTPIRQAIKEFAPKIVFNLLEAFADIGTFDQNVVSGPPFSQGTSRLGGHRFVVSFRTSAQVGGPSPLGAPLVWRPRASRESAAAMGSRRTSCRRQARSC